MGGYVGDEQTTFIVIDGEKRICGWEFMKSESNADAVPCLTAIKNRLGKPLLYVIVDNCCKVRFLYISVFGLIDVKLDVFHGVQR